jgi:iron(III) transport system ATP-binding protein
MEDLAKAFGATQAVDRISMQIDAGELFFLLGPSGCGKTTLLRCVAGFCQPDRGAIYFGDRNITQLPAHKRDAGMVFQSYALWPHMTVAENVGFGLETRGFDRAERSRKIEEALSLVKMDRLAERNPNQLSGGQQQRVALARALVIEPRCLLLDEPLSNLDAKLRQEMRQEIRRICKQTNITTIYVTHDQKEALAIADRIAVLNSGRVEQIGAPDEIYRRPVNRFVAGFVGDANFIPATVRTLDNGVVTCDTPVGEMTCTMQSSDARPGQEVSLLIRPESIVLNPPSNARRNVFAAQLSETVYLGEVAEHRAIAHEGELALKSYELNPRERRRSGHVRCGVDPDDVIVLTT